MTNDPSDTAARLETLEIRLMHQDALIGELNDVVAAQWRKIDLLGRQLAQLREEYQAIGPARDAPEPPPPHY